MTSNRIQDLNIDLSIIKFATDVTSQANVKMTCDFSGKHLSVKGKQLEIRKFGLQRGEKDLIDSGFDFRGSILFFVCFSTHAPGGAERGQHTAQEPP